MKLKLRITRLNHDGTSFSETFEIDRDSCTIGRGGADVVIEDACISRRHAMLYQGIRGELRVMDLHSTNGTFLGDERVIDKQIGQGSILRVANLAITVIDYAPDRASLGANLAYDRYVASRERDSQTTTIVFQSPEEVPGKSAAGGLSRRIQPMPAPWRKA